MICFIFSLKDISSSTVYRISMKKKTELGYTCKSAFSSVTLFLLVEAS